MSRRSVRTVGWSLTASTFATLMLGYFAPGFASVWTFAIALILPIVVGTYMLASTAA